MFMFFQTTNILVLDHFLVKNIIILCKQMDIYIRKVYIVRKVTSVPTILD